MSVQPVTPAIENRTVGALQESDFAEMSVRSVKLPIARLTSTDQAAASSPAIH
jgi:hypothetical protein